PLRTRCTRPHTSIPFGAKSGRGPSNEGERSNVNVQPHRDGSYGERGIALISALLILILLAIAAATFMSTTSGERGIASNVQVSRMSLLSADAGVRTGQQVLANMGKTKLDSLLLLWAGYPNAIIPNPQALFP